jgi:hypothetical protein
MLYPWPLKLHFITQGTKSKCKGVCSAAGKFQRSFLKINIFPMAYKIRYDLNISLLVEGSSHGKI